MPEGCPAWELALVEKVAWNLQYRQEHRQPHRYAKNGLSPLHQNKSEGVNNHHDLTQCRISV
ncbi:MAG TPA: hypothetical protein VMD30_09500 [Tepidisphaeraceae bacterium]|nr:hypothetical protein [Tepidisphaeraceae bacterium]